MKWHVDDGVQWEAPQPDFLADAELMMKKMEQEEEEKEAEEDVRPDHRANISQGSVQFLTFSSISAHGRQSYPHLSIYDFVSPTDPLVNPLRPFCPIKTNSCL